MDHSEIPFARTEGLPDFVKVWYVSRTRSATLSARLVVSTMAESCPVKILHSKFQHPRLDLKMKCRHVIAAFMDRGSA